MEFPPKGAATGSIHLLMSLVETGPSLAILPGSILRFGARPRLLRILNVNLPIPHWPVIRMTLKGRGQRAVVRLFAEQLRKAAAIKSA
jgi:DNA-binding transcriptional LysR family regulator